MNIDQSIIIHFEKIQSTDFKSAKFIQIIT